VTSLLKQVATLATSEVSAPEAMQWGLDLVCTHIGWPLGRVFEVGPDGDLLVATGIWHDEDPDAHRAFVEAFDAARVARDEGLPGYVFSHARAAWIDVMDDRVSVDARSIALSCGLRAAFAFPIVSDRGVEGVIEIIGPQRVEVDEDLLELFAHVGLQVGRVVERDRSRRQLREAERLAQLGSWSWEVERDVLDCSPELYRMHGMKEVDDDGAVQSLRFASFLAAAHPDDRAALSRAAAEVMLEGEPIDVEYRVAVGRRVKWVHIHAEVAERRGDRIVRLAGYCQDITVRRRAEERRRRIQRELAHQQRVLERIARGEPLHVTLTELCRYVERNYRGAHCSVLLLDRDAGLLRTGAGPTLHPEFSAAIDGLPVGEGVGACGTAAARGEIVIIDDTFTNPFTAAFLPLAQAHSMRSVWSHPLTKVSGEVLGTFALYRTTTHKPSRSEIKAVMTTGSLAALAIERSQSEEALLAAANFDALTRLPNRARFLELVNEQLAITGRRLSVMFLDLDRFKIINDSLGHPAGDRILREISERLRAVAGDGALVARFGGDEFTLLVPDADEPTVLALADRLRNAIEDPLVLDGGEFFLSVSIGIAVNDHPGDAFGLVRDADSAMYAAKGRGPGRHEVFDQKMRARLMEKLADENDLRRAIERNELVLHYQPILDLAERRWEGVEALVRWEHPTRGLLGPDRFIPLAEETGLIVPLGARVLQLVAEQAAAWAATLPGIHIAANTSVLQLVDPAIATDLIRLLHEHRLGPDAIQIEVTESAVMQELEAAHASLEQLMSAGIRVLIDDFGTGYSSIARLGDLPVAGLKIDRRFTAGLAADPAVRKVLSAISDLARAYGLKVVAEGIEDAISLWQVSAVGCHFAQGFHLGRPGPANVVEKVLAAPPPAL
jgi:diguanylate cyclase (GGDEF)-like protein